VRNSLAAAVPPGAKPNDAAVKVNTCHEWHPANEVQTALIFEEKCKSETFNYLFVIIKE